MPNKKLPYKRNPDGTLVLNRFGKPIFDYTKAEWYEPWMELSSPVLYHAHPEYIERDRVKYNKILNLRRLIIKPSKKGLAKEIAFITNALSQTANSTINMGGMVAKANIQASKEKEDARKKSWKPTKYFLQGVPIALAAYSGGIGILDKLGKAIPSNARKFQAFSDMSGALIDAGQTTYHLNKENYPEAAFNGAQAAIGTVGTLGDLNLLRTNRMGRYADDIIDYTNLGSNALEVGLGLYNFNKK